MSNDFATQILLLKCMFCFLIVLELLYFIYAHTEGL